MGAKKSRNGRVLTAKTADKYELYELSVQAPEDDAKFYTRYYRRYRGKPARVFREDFCGSAVLSAEWVKLHRDNVAIGVDLDPKVLAWGRERNYEPLKKAQRERLHLIEDDVMNVRAPKADVLCALNFSYSFFMTRPELLAYFRNARRSLAPDGLFFIDAWGGGESYLEDEEMREIENDRVGRFWYCWDQHKFDPVSHVGHCRIHFEFEDDTRIKNAFTYTWRMWTLPELQELMREAGFQDVHVLWEGTDRETQEGNGVFRRVTRGEADAAWIAYVVGAR